MKTARIIAVSLCVILSFTKPIPAQEMDKELSDVASKLAPLINENGKKRVAVLDFTDLQGGSSELGKYVAEQMIVNLVMVKSNFSVLDRANFRKILAEHKLTATGLIDPENAKKLGQFTGVDALILGTIVSKGQKVAVTAKIITTDTAEIVGAAKTEFKSDESIQQLLAQAAKSEETKETGGEQPATPATTKPKPFGDLQAKVESLKLLPGDNIYGSARLTFIITNTSATTTYGVAVNPDFYNKFNLSNSRGDEFKATEVSGIDTAFESGSGFAGSLTDIPPKTAITIVSKSQVRWVGKPGEYRPYRLQAIVYFSEESEGRYPNQRKYNLVLDIK